MVVVVIISLLMAFAIPTVQRIQMKARTTVVVNDFRIFAAAFQAYVHTHGAWPAETAAGVIPPELENELRGGPWARPTPLGGLYNWDQGVMHQGGFQPAAAITITKSGGEPPFSAAQLLDIDRTIDDGNLATGLFRAGAGNAPLYVIEP